MGALLVLSRYQPDSRRGLLCIKLCSSIARTTRRQVAAAHGQVGRAT